MEAKPEPAELESKETPAFYVSNNIIDNSRWVNGCPLFDEAAARTDLAFLPDNGAQFGRLQPSSKPDGDWVYLNTHEPFCGVAVGVQGAGKSYTTNVVIENCVLQTKHPLSVLVCHFDENPDTRCEATAMTASPTGERVVKKMVILVSPSRYFQRKEFYRDVPNCSVYPLLLDFAQLGSQELKQIMGVEPGQQQLYVSVILSILRRLEKTAKRGRMTFSKFKQLLFAPSTQGGGFQQNQSAPLKQRLDLIESFLFDATDNKEVFADCKAAVGVDDLYMNSCSVSNLFQPGTVVVADLSDPLMDQVDANRIFQVLVSLFRKAPLACGKLLVFDEAHKYLSREAGALCDNVVMLVRQMRHYGLRVFVSTQSPEVLSRELIELSSFVVLHRFSSPDWFHHLGRLMPLPARAQWLLPTLPTGEALVYAAGAKVLRPHARAMITEKPGDMLATGDEDGGGPPRHHLFRVLVRKRATEDYGSSVLSHLEHLAL